MLQKTMRIVLILNNRNRYQLDHFNVMANVLFKYNDIIKLVVRYYFLRSQNQFILKIRFIYL